MLGESGKGGFAAVLIQLECEATRQQVDVSIDGFWWWKQTVDFKLAICIDVELAMKRPPMFQRLLFDLLSSFTDGGSANEVGIGG